MLCLYVYGVFLICCLGFSCLGINFGCECFGVGCGLVVVGCMVIVDLVVLWFVIVLDYFFCYVA